MSTKAKAKNKSKAGVVAQKVPEATLRYYKECLELLLVPDIDDLVLPAEDLLRPRRDARKINGLANTSIRQASPKRRKIAQENSSRLHSVAANSSSSDEPLEKVAKSRKGKASPEQPNAAASLDSSSLSEKAKAKVPEQPIDAAPSPSGAATLKVAQPGLPIDDQPVLSDPVPEKAPRDRTGPSATHTEETPSDSRPVETVEAKSNPVESAFNREKLKALSRIARAKGRTLKHAGDARLRSPATGNRPSPESYQLCVFEQCDSLLLYVYSFWCDDLLNGRTDSLGRYTKPIPDVRNWSTIGGLAVVVRQRAEQERLSAIVSLLNLVEALIEQHIQAQERRNLYALINSPNTARKVASQPANGSLNGSTPESSAASPITHNLPPDTANRSMMKAQEGFLAHSLKMEKIAKLLSDSQDILSIASLQQEHKLPELAWICKTSDTRRRMVAEPKQPWRFAWGLETDASHSMLCQAVCFGRALIEQLAAQKGLDYKATWSED